MQDPSRPHVCVALAPDSCRRGSGPVRLTRAAVTYSKIALSGMHERMLAVSIADGHASMAE